MFSRAERQPTGAATAPIPYQAGSPTYHVYRVEIPAGWRALLPVFYPVPPAPEPPVRPGIPAALVQAMQQFRAGVLLCRSEEDGQAARREFEAGISLEAAFLGQDGRYLRVAQGRPAYGVLPLAAPSPATTGPGRSVECLVFLPLLDVSPDAARGPIPPIMMMLDGFIVHGAKEAA